MLWTVFSSSLLPCFWCIQRGCYLCKREFLNGMIQCLSFSFLLLPKTIFLCLTIICIFIFCNGKRNTCRGFLHLRTWQHYLQRVCILPKYWNCTKWWKHDVNIWWFAKDFLFWGRNWSPKKLLQMCMKGWVADGWGIGLAALILIVGHCNTAHQALKLLESLIIRHCTNGSTDQ